MPLFLLLAAACAAGTGGDRTGGEAGLSSALAGRTAGAPRACVPASLGATLVPRGRQTLALERGDTIWVNRLAAPCPGLDEMSQLIVELHGSQYCRGDPVRARSAGQSLPGPICVLGAFTPYRR